MIDETFHTRWSFEKVVESDLQVGFRRTRGVLRQVGHLQVGEGVERGKC